MVHNEAQPMERIHNVMQRDNVRKICKRAKAQNDRALMFVRSPFTWTLPEQRRLYIGARRRLIMQGKIIYGANFLGFPFEITSYGNFHVKSHCRLLIVSLLRTDKSNID